MISSLDDNQGRAISPALVWPATAVLSALSVQKAASNTVPAALPSVPSDTEVAHHRGARWQSCSLSCCLPTVHPKGRLSVAPRSWHPVFLCSRRETWGVAREVMAPCWPANACGVLVASLSGLSSSISCCGVAGRWSKPPWSVQTFVHLLKVSSAPAPAPSTSNLNGKTHDRGPAAFSKCSVAKSTPGSPRNVSRLMACVSSFLAGQYSTSPSCSSSAFCPPTKLQLPAVSQGQSLIPSPTLDQSIHCLSPVPSALSHWNTLSCVHPPPSPRRRVIGAASVFANVAAAMTTAASTVFVSMAMPVVFAQLTPRELTVPSNPPRGRCACARARRR